MALEAFWHYLESCVTEYYSYLVVVAIRIRTVQAAMEATHPLPVLMLTAKR